MVTRVSTIIFFIFYGLSHFVSSLILGTITAIAALVAAIALLANA